MAEARYHDFEDTVPTAPAPLDAVREAWHDDEEERLHSEDAARAGEMLAGMLCAIALLFAALVVAHLLARLWPAF